MKKAITLFFIPFLALLFTACPVDPVDTTGNVTGIIKDANTNANLQGVSVTLSPSGKTTITGSDGSYQFMDIEQGTYKVSVSKANYQPDEKTVTVRVNETSNLDFSLRPAGSALEVTPLTLDFGDTDTNLSFDIKNTGQATMTWQVTEDVTWLSCTPASGSIPAGKMSSVIVTIDRSTLTKGTYTNTLVVTSNDGGSQTVRFTVTVSGTTSSLPQVAIIGVDGVTDVAATFIGTLTSIGSSRVTAHGFCWSTQQQPTLQQGQHKDLGQTDEPKTQFSYGVPNLSPNTTYYVRAYATNAEGTVYSSREERFTTTTTPQKPDVETGAVTQITSSTAVVAGNILALGHDSGITEHGHVWSATVKQPTIDYDHTSLGATKQTGGFSSNLTKLKPNTIYYVCAYARNQYGMSYGDVVQFTTQRAEVKLTTNSVTNIIHNEATCGGRITDLGGNTISERGVCWNTSVNPTIAHSHSASTEKTDNFNVRLTNLTEKTTYHVRAYVVTETGETYYGQDVQFQTTQIITLPELSEVSVTSVTYKKATFTAKITSLGNGTIKRSGFCYSTEHNPTINNTSISCGTASDLQATASSLKPKTTYYVRAYAENEKGITYSEEKNFTTLEKPEDGDIQREEWGDDDNWNY